MATYHQQSPNAAHQHHHGQPLPPHMQPNGHAEPPLAHQGPPVPARPPTAAELRLARLYTETWVLIGRLFEGMAHNPQALEAYKRAHSHDKQNVDALRCIASILRTEDQYESAIEYIRQILQLCPTDGESWSSLGHCYLMMDELQQAYTAYQSALYNLRDPKEPKLWYGIGILYDRYGSLDHAEEAFSQVMRMAPEFDKANEIYFRLGIIYKQQAKYQQSLECFQYIVQNPPQPLSQTDIWFQIGHVYEQQKDYESAKRAYLRVLDRDPHHAKVLQQLGWLHHQQSSDYATQESAIEFLEKSVSSDQTDAQSWYLLGRCYMSQHKFPKAYEAYQQAVYRDGRNPTFWCSIGVLYYQINQYRDALDAYSRAIRLNPNISEVWYDLGTLYESCNNQTSDALDAYERAAQLDPSNNHIKARLALLRNGQSGISSQNGVPPGPQDVAPHHYQSAAAAPNGPPAQWGAPQGGPPPGQGPPPPPLRTGEAPRDWTQRIGDMHSSQPPPPGQGPPQLGQYDQRDGRGPPFPGRQPTPPYDRMRGAEPRGTPMQRPLSPSPRARNVVPSLFHAQNGPPPPGGPLPGIVQQGGPPPPRQGQQLSIINNPSYPHPSALPPGPPPPGQGPQGSYGRGSPGPGPEIRPIITSQPPSPRSGYPYQATPHQMHRQAPAGFAPIGGPTAPSPALPPVDVPRERERERERDERERSAMPPAPKRHREWEDREEPHKKNATDESRTRLDEISRRDATPATTLPSIGRDGLERRDHFAPPPIHDRERDRMPIGGPSRPGSALASQPPSPAASRRAEEVRRANETYKPSEAAHHPAPLNTLLHQEPALRNHQGPPPPPSQAATPRMPSLQPAGPGSNHPTPQPHQQHLPPPPPSAPTPREQRQESARPEQQPVHQYAPINIAPKREEPERMDIDDDHRRRMEQQYQEEQKRVEPPKRPEEPAARKMDVDEDYDEESEKGSVKNGGAVPASNSSSKGSPRAPVVQQNGVRVDGA